MVESAIADNFSKGKSEREIQQMKNKNKKLHKKTDTYSKFPTKVFIFFLSNNFIRNREDSATLEQIRREDYKKLRQKTLFDSFFETYDVYIMKTRQTIYENWKQNLQMP